MVFPAIMVALGSIVFFGSFWLGTICLSIWIIRILLTKNRRIIVLSLFIMMLFTVASWYFVCTLQQQKQVNRSINTVIRIQADEVKINGDTLSGIATVAATNQKMIFLYRLPNEGAQIHFRQIKVPQKLTVQGEVAAIERPTNFNQFDLRQYYRCQKISNQLMIKSVTSIKSVKQMTLVDRIHWYRAKFNQYCQQLPKHLKVYALGLISGYRDDSFYQLTPGVSKLGLLHLFSISGMHVYYFLGILDWCLGWLPTKIKILIELIWLLLYFIFAGATAGLLRAIIAASLGLLARLNDRQLSGLDCWSLCLILNLMIFPASLFLMACQLSYGLSFGLVLLNKIPAWRRTLGLNFISLPIILYHFYEWHFLSLLANLLLLPIFSIIVFPLVILGVLIYPVTKKLGNLINLVLQIFNDLINLLGNLPGMITFGKPGMLSCMIMFGLVLFLYITKKRLGRRLMISGLIFIYSFSYFQIHLPREGEIAMFDVGQGDSFLIREPYNHSVTLIDTGGKVQFGRPQNWQQRQRKYQADRIAINYLKSQGIKTIDYLCISHQDADHCGDLPAYLKSMNIKMVVVGDGVQINPNFQRRLTNISNTIIQPVTDAHEIKQLPLQIYHPFKVGSGKNEDSLVLGGKFGGLNWLFTGDLDRNSECQVIKKYPNLQADILKIGHHGSKTASALEFIESLKPSYALISAGRNNHYGHPNPEIMQILSTKNIKNFNTQTMGMVRFKYTDERITIVKTKIGGLKGTKHELFRI